MSTPATTPSPLAEHRSFLFGLCYRMTGSAADAEDLVQETFVRALERPPARTSDPWRPWLTTVAMNLSRDALRKRRRTPYEGPWLPSPIALEEDPPSFEAAARDGDPGTAGRYDLLESASFAFLLALEVLTPAQRAVLLLRDVFDYSVTETAAALAMSEPNVKTTHHRARKALEPYDAHRYRPSPERGARSIEALTRFLQGLAAGDVAGVEATLAASVRMTADSGGEFTAGRKVMAGIERVRKLWFGLQKQGSRFPMRFSFVTLNGMPALVIERDWFEKPHAPRFVLRCEIDDEGRITELQTVVATRKLAAIAPLPA